ncbi:hypothetical protein [Streptomyces sp. NPDC001415]
MARAKVNAAALDSAVIVRAVVDAAFMVLAVIVPAVAVGTNWAMPGLS